MPGLGHQSYNKPNIAQDGSIGVTQRGYFEVPETDEEWPKCVTGNEHHE